jgi:hypothetical protein
LRAEGKKRLFCKALRVVGVEAAKLKYFEELEGALICISLVSFDRKTICFHRHRCAVGTSKRAMNEGKITILSEYCNCVWSMSDVALDLRAGGGRLSVAVLNRAVFSVQSISPSSISIVAPACHGIIEKLGNGAIP